jgi:anti-sigma B factor antagonist
LEVTSESLRGTRVIAVTGEIDLSSVTAVQAHIDAAFADGESHLVIDLEHVPFLDSAALHMLVRALQRARRAGGSIALVCVDPSIRRMLDVFGLSGEIEICDTVSEAITALTGR